MYLLYQSIIYLSVTFCLICLLFSQKKISNLTHSYPNGVECNDNWNFFDHYWKIHGVFLHSVLAADNTLDIPLPSQQLESFTPHIPADQICTGLLYYVSSYECCRYTEHVLPTWIFPPWIIICLSDTIDVDRRCPPPWTHAPYAHP